MERLHVFRTPDGETYDVPEGQRESFLATAQQQGLAVEPAQTFQDENGDKYDVPESQAQETVGAAQQAGRKVERVFSVKSGDETFDVPEPKRAEFLTGWRKTPDAAAVRAEAEKRSGKTTVAGDFLRGLNEGGDNPIAGGIAGRIAGLERPIIQAGKQLGLPMGAVERNMAGNEALAARNAPGERDLSGKIMAGAGAAAIDLPAIGAVSAVKGLSLLGFPLLAATEASATGDPAEVAKAAANALLLQKSLHGTRGLAATKRVAGGGALFGGLSAAEGGNVQDVTAATALGLGLSASGPGMPTGREILGRKARVTGEDMALAESGRTAAERRWNERQAREQAALTDQTAYQQGQTGLLDVLRARQARQEAIPPGPELGAAEDIGPFVDPDVLARREAALRRPVQEPGVVPGAEAAGIDPIEAAVRAHEADALGLPPESPAAAPAPVAPAVAPEATKPATVAGKRATATPTAYRTLAEANFAAKTKPEFAGMTVVPEDGWFKIRPATATKAPTASEPAAREPQPPQRPGGAPSEPPVDHTAVLVAYVKANRAAYAAIHKRLEAVKLEAKYTETGRVGVFRQGDYGNAARDLNAGAYVVSLYPDAGLPGFDAKKTDILRTALKRIDKGFELTESHLELLDRARKIIEGERQEALGPQPGDRVLVAGGDTRVVNAVDDGTPGGMESLPGDVQARQDAAEQAARPDLELNAVPQSQLDAERAARNQKAEVAAKQAAPIVGTQGDTGQRELPGVENPQPDLGLERRGAVLNWLGSWFSPKATALRRQTHAQALATRDADIHSKNAIAGSLAQSKATRDRMDVLVQSISKSRWLSEGKRRAHKDVETEVADELGNVVGEDTLTMPSGEKLYRSEIAHMDAEEMVALAKSLGVDTADRKGWEIASDIIAERELAGTSSRITADELADYWGGSAAEKARLKTQLDAWVKEAHDGAAKYRESLMAAGLPEEAAFAAENLFYTHFVYNRFIEKSFTADPARRAAAVEEEARIINRTMDRLAKGATNLSRSLGWDVASYMGEASDVRAGQMLDSTGAAPRMQAQLVGLRDAWRVISDVTATPRMLPDGTVILRDADATAQQARVMRAADAYIEDLLRDKPEGDTGIPPTGFGAAHDAQMERDFNPVFRRMFEVVTDPRQAFPIARYTQEQLVAKYAMFLEMAKTGGIASTNLPEGRPLGHTVRLGASQNDRSPITPQERKQFGVLAGMWVAPETKAQFEGMGGWMGSRNPVLRTFFNIVGVQRATAILRPAAWGRDAGTNVTGYALANGDITPRFVVHYAKAVRNIMRLMSPDAAQRAIGHEWEADLARRGVFRPGMSSMIADIAGSKEGGGKLSRAWSSVLRFRSIIGDAAVKDAAYHSRLDLLRSWNKRAVAKGKSPALTKAELELQASEHVQYYYDNRDTVPLWVRKAAKSPGVDFLTYKYSSTRAAFRAVEGTVKQLRDPTVPAEYKVQRMLGLAAAFSLQAGLAAVSLDWFKKRQKELSQGLAWLYGHKLNNPVDAGAVVEKAHRYMGEDYFRSESMTVHVDADNNMIRTIWGNGATTPYWSTVDAGTGLLDAGEVRGFNKTWLALRGIQRQAAGMPMFAATVGGDFGFGPDKGVWQRSAEAVGNFTAGAKATTKETREAYMAAGHKDLSDALQGLSSDYLGWFFRGLEQPGNAVINTSFNVNIPTSQDRATKAQQDRMTKTMPNGRVITRGIGDRPGISADEFMSTKTGQAAFMQGILPMNVRLYKPADINSLLLRRATDLSRTIHANFPEKTEQREGWSKGAKRELGNRELAPMADWAYHADVLLDASGRKAPAERSRYMRDVLGKANFSAREIGMITSGLAREKAVAK